MKSQAELARYQAEISERNQKLAEEEASAKRRQGYESMIAKRQETAKLIGRQRAALGASGAALDEGSALDMVADTAERGEMDAINLYNQGIDAGYQSQIQAWNFGNNAASERANADAYDSAAVSAMPNGLLAAGQTALGGIGSMASAWGGYMGKSSNNLNLDSRQTSHWDRAAQTWSNVKPRH